MRDERSLSAAFRAIDISKRVGSAGANGTHGISHKRPFSYSHGLVSAFYTVLLLYAGTNDPDFVTSNEHARPFTCMLETCI